MGKPHSEPYCGYCLRWDDKSDEELHYLYLSEARELFRAMKEAGVYRKIELFGVVSEQSAGLADSLDPLDLWERPTR